MDKLVPEYYLTEKILLPRCNKNNAQVVFFGTIRRSVFQECDLCFFTQHFISHLNGIGNTRMIRNKQF